MLSLEWMKAVDAFLRHKIFAKSEEGFPHLWPEQGEGISGTFLGDKPGSFRGNRKAAGRQTRGREVLTQPTGRCCKVCSDAGWELHNESLGRGSPGMHSARAPTEGSSSSSLGTAVQGPSAWSPRRC